MSLSRRSWLGYEISKGTSEESTGVESAKSEPSASTRLRQIQRDDMCKAEDVRESSVAAKAEDDVRGALYNKKPPELGPKAVYDFLAREWELGTKKTPRHPPRTKKQIELGFPAPAAFWVGLRPFIFMVPITMVLPPVYLISHASGAHQVVSRRARGRVRMGAAGGQGPYQLSSPDTSAIEVWSGMQLAQTIPRL